MENKQVCRANIGGSRGTAKYVKKFYDNKSVDEDNKMQRSQPKNLFYYDFMIIKLFHQILGYLMLYFRKVYVDFMIFKVMAYFMNLAERTQIIYT